MPGHSDAARPIQGRARVCQLDWFINSRCDYACRHCVPGACGKGRRDVDLAACRKALRSFLSFCAAQQREARITFFPRQAEFAEPFLTILREASVARRRGRLGQIVSANRGDLPADKIRLFAEAGVDACRLTMDGPEAVQDVMRRPGSFRDTLTAFHATRASGVRVIPLLILVRFNAPHIARTLRMLLDDGFDGFALQVGIRGDAGAGSRKASVHPDPSSPWNDLLTASDYRAVLLRALNFLDTTGPAHRDERAQFVLRHPMYARLFFELGRLNEYERLAAHHRREDILPFVLRPDGSVLCQQQMPELGTFPGGSFQKMFDTAHPLHWFGRGASLVSYMARKQRTFFKCRDCPVSRHCPPELVGAQGRRLFFQPDVHCWVEEKESVKHAATN